MKITVNGEESEINDGISISALLELREVKMPDMVSVELNGGIIDRNTFGDTVLKDGDKVEFLYFMGGGAATDCMGVSVCGSVGVGTDRE